MSLPRSGAGAVHARTSLRHHPLLRRCVACHQQPGSFCPLQPPFCSSARLLPVRSARKLHRSARHGSLDTTSSSHPPDPPPAPRPASGLGIRDRLRFWRYDQDLKRQEMMPAFLDDASLAGSSPDAQQVAEDVDDDGDDTFTDYVAELDRLSGAADDMPPSLVSYQPGDIVELPGPGDLSSRLAIYVRLVAGFMQFYTIEGRLVLSPRQHALFIASGFVEPKHLDPILPHLPASRNIDASRAAKFYGDSVPRAKGRHLLKRLVDFHTSFQHAYRLHAAAFNDAHARVAHPTHKLVMTLEEIACKLTGMPVADISAPTLLALSDSLLRNGFGFRIGNRSYGRTRKLEVESLAGVASANRVMQWARAYQERGAIGVAQHAGQVPHDVLDDAAVIDKFVDKIRPIVNASRRVRNMAADGTVLSFKTDQDPASHLSALDTEFDSADLDIIRAISFFVSTQSFSFHPVMRSMLPVILKATDLYNDRLLDAETARTMLIEIGVMQPFQDNRPWDREMIDHSDSDTAAVDALEAKAAGADDTLHAAGLHDSLGDLRVDFGDMPVFCIDAASASVIDDGVSIEEARDGPGQWWVHAHIASVASFIPPSHVLARYAEARSQTHYMPESSTPMLPSWITSPLSLAPDRPCLTVSVRLDASGNTLETRIRPGIVRNVIRLSKDQVDLFFGAGSSKIPLNPALLVGPDTRPPGAFAEAASPVLSEAAAQALRNLLETTSKLHRRRTDAAPMGVLPESRRFALSVQAGGRDIPACMSVDRIPSKPSFATADPSVQYLTNSRFEEELLGLHNRNPPSVLCVEEVMLLANRCAAQWAADRGVPIPFFSTQPAVGGVDLERKLLQTELRDMAKGKTPFRRETLMWFRSLFGGTRIAVEPREHRPLGFPAYTQVTSPLRRHHDLVAHWNIAAALREEARRGGRALAPADDKAFLAVPLPALHALVRRHRWRYLEIHRFNKAHGKHWILYALARAFYARESPLPDVLTGVVGQWNGARRPIRIESLDIITDAADVAAAAGEKIEMGDRWEVRILRVLLGAKRVIVEPVRLVSRRPADDAGKVAANELTLRFKAPPPAGTSAAE